MARILRRSIMLIALFMLCINAGYIQAQENGNSYLQDPESLIRELYKAVSQKPGEKMPDWEKVRNMFYDKAIISLREGRNKYKIYDVDGFIKEFQKFYQDPRVVKEKGFTETILNLNKAATGKIAHVLIHYDARIANGAGNEGIDSCQLINMDGRWWIFSITNEVVDRFTPVPDILKK